VVVVVGGEAESMSESHSESLSESLPESPFRERHDGLEAAGTGTQKKGFRRGAPLGAKGVGGARGTAAR
jgi:hypothetical protein